MVINLTYKDYIKKKKHLKREKESIDFRKNLKPGQTIWVYIDKYESEVNMKFLKYIDSNTILCENGQDNWEISLNSVYPYYLPR